MAAAAAAVAAVSTTVDANILAASGGDDGGGSASSGAVVAVQGRQQAPCELVVHQRTHSTLLGCPYRRCIGGGLADTTTTRRRSSATYQHSPTIWAKQPRCLRAGCLGHEIGCTANRGRCAQTKETCEPPHRMKMARHVHAVLPSPGQGRPRIRRQHVFHRTVRRICRTGGNRGASSSSSSSTSSTSTSRGPATMRSHCGCCWSGQEGASTASTASTSW